MENYKQRKLLPKTLLYITKMTFLLFVMAVFQSYAADENTQLTALTTKSASDVNDTEKSQQTRQISGTITDEKGEPIIGANIIEKGTTNGTVTDFDGNFTLQVANNATIRISYIGYIEQEIATGNRNSFAIVLTEDTQALDELVVVGYGTMRKSDVTGSISTAKGTDIIKSQSFNALEGLRGKAAGVNIFSNTGQPGGETRVIIRGISTINASASPLYVVDGVVMQNFNFLNPNDIESIEVLKDASSAAIYGARGANGVIIVTTKRSGDTGKKALVSYDGSMSVSTMAGYMDVMNSGEWMAAFKQGLEMQIPGKIKILQLIYLRFLQIADCSMLMERLNMILIGKKSLHVQRSLITTN